MAYTIRSAIDSGVFDNVMAVVPAYTVRDSSPDIEWIDWILNELDESYEVFSILRATSPFRTDENIREAYQEFYVHTNAHSLRTVQKVTEHPGKMWVIRQGQLLPLLPMGPASFPWHSSGTQTLFEAYIQTAGMEFARVRNTLDTKTIAGSNVIPYVVEGWPALDINNRYDWQRAEEGIENGTAPIPESLK